MVVTVDRPLDAFEQSILDVIREVAGGVLDDSRAELDVSFQEAWTNFELRPSNPRACPVIVSVNREGHPPLPLALGKDQRLYELWADDSDEGLLRELRLCLKPILEGGYEEEWRQVRRRRRSSTQFVGTLHTDEGPIQFMHEGREPERLQKRRRYAAY
jgi:hypothetical protein